ncbi:MAG: isoprenyl transferase [Muribaculaceae bacterium]|jgi:undecaprenyl diphosphate synthase|nr:isoprenyl transferase [Muribaculaceae bacterium]MEE0975907.1 isoprenyl transferase [Muribaculaceae bacterium]
MSLKENIDANRLPQHVAIIMDGNGRWAKARNMERSAGHVEGVNTVRQITEAASELGVKYLTLYTFSTENWNRPQDEVDALMHLIVIAIERETPDLIKNNVRLTMIGDFSRMPAEAYERLCQCGRDTAHCTGLTLCLALSYSARWEITEACRQIAQKIADGQLAVNDICDNTISAHLTTNKFPDPDLLIRTGGEMRISNFMLWQIAYSEIYVTDTYWPDFSKECFYQAIIDFQSRERRFGKTSEQVK